MKYKLSKYAVKMLQLQDSIILYNAVTGCVIKLEQNIYEKLLSSDFDETVPYFKELFKNRFIVFFHQDEYKLLKSEEKVAQCDIHNNDSPLFIITPTLNCNLKCVYCFENNCRSNPKMSKDIIDKTVDFILNQINSREKINSVSVEWFGGEPLLAFDEIISIGTALKKAFSKKQIAFESEIITNGILFTPNKVRELIDSCNLKRAQITLDGMCENYCKKKCATPNEFNTVISNILSASTLINISVRLNADKENFNDMFSLADLIYSQADNNAQLDLYLAKLNNYLSNSKDADKFFSASEFRIASQQFNQYIANKGYVKPKERKLPNHNLTFCEVSKTGNFVIGPLGELYKCEHYVGTQENVVGDVVNGLYYNKPYFEFYLGVNDPLCQKCDLYPACNTNCPESHALVKRDGEKCCYYETLKTHILELITDNLKNRGKL